MGSKEIHQLKYREGFSFIGILGKRKANEKRANDKRDQVTAAQIFETNPHFLDVDNMVIKEALEKEEAELTQKATTKAIK